MIFEIVLRGRSRLHLSKQ